MATSNTQDFKASLWCTRSKEMTGSILKCIYVILEHHEFSSITLRVLVILPQTQLEMFKLVSIRRRQLSKERMSFEAATKILRNSAKSLNIKEKKIQRNTLKFRDLPISPCLSSWVSLGYNPTTGTWVGSLQLSVCAVGSTTQLIFKYYHS